MRTLAQPCNYILLSATNDSLKIYMSCLHSFVLYETSENEVSACVDYIKTNPAYGNDSNPSKFVKMAKCVLVLFLQNYLTSALKKEFFMKKSKLPMLYQFLKFSLLRHLGTYALNLSLYYQCFQKSLKKF